MRESTAQRRTHVSAAHGIPAPRLYLVFLCYAGRLNSHNRQKKLRRMCCSRCEVSILRKAIERSVLTRAMATTLSIRGTTLAFASGAAVGVAVAALLRLLNQYRPPTVWAEPSLNPDPLKLDSPKAGARRERPLPVGAHAIQLYSLGTPNGCKVTILLEEICAAVPSFDYDAWRVSIMDGEQFDSGFVDVSPNSKIPAMVDTSTGAKLFESGAIRTHHAKCEPTGCTTQAGCGCTPSTAHASAGSHLSRREVPCVRPAALGPRRPGHRAQLADVADGERTAPWARLRPVLSLCALSLDLTISE